MNNKKILYLYTGNHIIHRKFAQSVDAKIIPMTWKIPKSYNIYFTEGEFFKPVILRIFGLIKKKSKIINLFSDPRLFYLDRGLKYDVLKQRVRRYSWIKKKIFEKLLNKLDGVICVGSFEKEMLDRHYFGFSKRVDIFVEKDFQKRLLKIKPKLSLKRVLFIGNGPDFFYKGTDFLLDVAKKCSKVSFTIVGGFYDNLIRKKGKLDNVKFIGQIKMNSKEMEKIISEHQLYVHFGRGEAFGVTVLESMSAGIPAIVSDLTGAKEAIKKIEPGFVVPLDVNLASKKIEEYFNLNLKNKKILSNKFRKVSKFYNEDKQLKKFKEVFNNLLGEIYGKR